MTYCSNLQGLQHLYPRSDSGWRLQKAQDTNRCPVLFVVSHPTSDSAPHAESVAESGSHSPLEGQGACSLDAERANIRAWREIPGGFFDLLVSKLVSKFKVK